MYRLWVCVVAGCSSGSGSLVASTTFTVSESSGIGPSHLDVLNGQTVAIEIEFPSPVETFPVVGGCPTNERTQPEAPTSATGASAAMVKTEILDYLPEWRLRLSLCDVAAQSSFQLASDNFMNTGFTIGCTDVPASAMKRDGAGHPVWSSFTTSPTCTLTILDANTNRVLGARDFAVRISL